MDYDYEFIVTYNDRYPFERYIFKEPKSIGNLFDDVLLTEIFIPSTEIKVYFEDDGSFAGCNEVPNDEIYIKLKGPGGEFRMGYWDFEEGIRDNIRDIFYREFGEYEWQSLYMEYETEEEYDELKEVLQTQKQMIIEKYGECNIKEHTLDDVIKKLIE